jgi:CRP-like cAMP-binding protein
VNKQALTTKLAGVPDETQPVRRRAIQAEPQQMDKVLFEKERTEEHLLALALLQPKLRTYLYQLQPDMISGAQQKVVFDFLQEHPDYDGKDKTAVQKFADYAKILSLVYETLYQDLESVELGYEAARLQKKLIEQYVRTEKQQLVSRLQTADQKEAESLLKRAAELDELLRLN